MGIGTKLLRKVSLFQMLDKLNDVKALRICTVDNKCRDREKRLAS